MTRKSIWAAENTAMVAGNWYEQAAPNEMALIQLPRVQLEQLRVLMIEGTLHPNPIMILTKSRPVSPRTIT